MMYMRHMSVMQKREESEVEREGGEERGREGGREGGRAGQVCRYDNIT